MNQEGKKPSVVQLQGFIRDGQRLRFVACDGGSYTGHLKWFDDQSFCLELSDGDSFTLLRHSVIGYGPAPSS
ncbi:MAG: hypothetical protein AB7W16_02815 [Candidatus Obscuribacterales bacterium]